MPQAPATHIGNSAGVKAPGFRLAQSQLFITVIPRVNQQPETVSQSIYLSRLLCLSKWKKLIFKILFIWKSRVKEWIFLLLVYSPQWLRQPVLGQAFTRSLFWVPNTGAGPRRLGHRLLPSAALAGSWSDTGAAGTAVSAHAGCFTYNMGHVIFEEQHNIYRLIEVLHHKQASNKQKQRLI